MEDPKGTSIVDLSVRLPAFLTRFVLLEFNNLLASHLHRFELSFSSILCFSMPREGLLLLEELFMTHGDFTARFRGRIFLGNILLELLYSVLISLKNASLYSLFKEELLEWKKVMQDLVEAKFDLPFLLEYLQSVAHALF